MFFVRVFLAMFFVGTLPHLLKACLGVVLSAVVRRLPGSPTELLMHKDAQEWLTAFPGPDSDPQPSEADMQKWYPLQYVLYKMPKAERVAKLEALRDSKTLQGFKFDAFTHPVFFQLGQVNFNEYHGGFAEPVFHAVDVDVGEAREANRFYLASNDGHSKKTLKKEKKSWFTLPVVAEEANTGRLENWRNKLKELVSMVVLSLLPLEPLADPQFFKSDQEAAVCFQLLHAAKRVPEDAGVMGRFNEALILGGGQSETFNDSMKAFAFCGIGQLRLRGVQFDEGRADWPGRTASPKCRSQVPETAKFVIDVSDMADLEVRKPFLRYGGAMFFDGDKQPIAVWVEPDSKMVERVEPQSPGWDEWTFACERVKCSHFWDTFTMHHLSRIHWTIANTAIVCMRERLEPPNALRRLIWPHCQTTLALNHLGISTLVGDRGGAVRTGACTGRGSDHHLDLRVKEFLYQPFEEEFSTEVTGLAEKDLAQLPFIQDGRELNGIYREYVTDWLNLHYPTDTDLQNDPEIQDFWTAVRETFLGLPRLPRGKVRDYLPREVTKNALTDYVVHVLFNATGMHELMATILLEVSGGQVATRILPKEYLEGEFFLSIQDYFGVVGQAALLTAQPTPHLIPTVKAMADMAIPKSPDEAEIFTRFYNQLEVLATEIEKKNSVGGARAGKEFGTFNPRRLEVSVNL